MGKNWQAHRPVLRSHSLQCHRHLSMVSFDRYLWKTTTYLDYDSPQGLWELSSFFWAVFPLCWYLSVLDRHLWQMEVRIVISEKNYRTVLFLLCTDLAVLSVARWKHQRHIWIVASTSGCLWGMVATGHSGSVRKAITSGMWIYDSHFEGVLPSLRTPVSSKVDKRKTSLLTDTGLRALLPWGLHYTLVKVSCSRDLYSVKITTGWT